MISNADFKKLCEERTNWPIRVLTYREERDRKKQGIYTGMYSDTLFDQLINSDRYDFWYIGWDEIVCDYLSKNKTFWKLQGIFQLNYLFDDIFIVNKKIDHWPNLKYDLFHFVKSDSEIEIKFNSEKDVDYNNLFHNKYFKVFVDEKYSWDKHVKNTIEFSNYDDFIEFHPALFDDVKLPTFDTETSVPKENFFSKYITFLTRYKPEVTDIFDFPNPDEEFGPLKDYGSFLDDERDEPDERIQINDIILSGYKVDAVGRFDSDIEIVEDPFLPRLIDSSRSASNDIFRGKTATIINYLFYYLDNKNNRVVKDFLLYGYTPFGDGLENFPVFFSQNHEVKEDIVIHRNFSTYDTDSVLDNLKETLYNKSQIRESIVSDLEEILKCYNAGAYKAAIILIGSILEAFLIDWISEKDKGKVKDNDYSKKNNYPYEIFKSKKDGKPHKKYIKTLDGYITRLQESYNENIDRPPWSKANKIKDKRNCVHPKKLFYAKKNELNQRACWVLYGYLLDIMKHRYNKGLKAGRGTQKSQ